MNDIVARLEMLDARMAVLDARRRLGGPVAVGDRAEMSALADERTALLDEYDRRAGAQS